MLAIEFQALIDSEFDLSFTGFSLAEIDLTFDQAREASVETPDGLDVIQIYPKRPYHARAISGSWENTGCCAATRGRSVITPVCLAQRKPI